MLAQYVIYLIYFWQRDIILRTILHIRMLRLRKIKSFVWLYTDNLDSVFLQIVFYFYYT